MTGELAAKATRVATLTSVIRTRKGDAVRRELHDGLPRDLNARAVSAIVRLERVAERLEKAIT